MTFQPSIFVCCHYQIAIFVLVLWACATHLYIWREIKKYYVTFVHFFIYFFLHFVN